MWRHACLWHDVHLQEAILQKCCDHARLGFEPDLQVERWQCSADMTAAVQLSPRLSVCADTPPPAMTDCLQKMTPEKTLRRDLCKPDHGRAGATGGQVETAKCMRSCCVICRAQLLNPPPPLLMVCQVFVVSCLQARVIAHAGGVALQQAVCLAVRRMHDLSLILFSRFFRS